MPPKFGFGITPGGVLGGYQATKLIGDDLMGNNFEGYAKSGEMERDLDAAMEGFARGDGTGFVKVQSKLARFGKEGTLTQLIQQRALALKSSMEMERESRGNTEFSAIQNETQPRPAELGTPELGMREDEGPERALVRGPRPETAPAYAGRSWNQNDYARMAQARGGKAFDSFSGSDDFLTIPQKQEQLTQQGNASGAQALQTQTKIEDLPGRSESGKPTNRQIAQHPSLRGLLPQQGRIPSEAGNRIFAAVMEATDGDTDAATEAREAYERRIAAARGTGRKKGELDVTTTPPYLQNQTDIAAARTAGQPLDASTQKEITGLEGALRQVENIEKSLDPEFLGPVKGRDVTFEARRQVGKTIGVPLDKNEVTFRESLSDLQDQLLRARSGAAITREEYQRLTKILPKATDEPEVFKTGLARFKAEITAAIQSKAKLGTTPRNQVGSGVAGPKALPKVLSIEKVQ